MILLSNLVSIDWILGPMRQAGDVMAPCYCASSPPLSIFTPLLANPTYFHQLVYYHFYTKDGAIQSLNLIYSNDPFISCILPKSITPPHTALSLKKHLCKIEGVAGFRSNVSLFEALSSNAAISDSTCLNLLIILAQAHRLASPWLWQSGLLKLRNDQAALIHRWRS